MDSGKIPTLGIRERKVRNSKWQIARKKRGEKVRNYKWHVANDKPESGEKRRRGDRRRGSRLSGM